MAIDFNDYDDALLFVPLGGSNEIGMNLNLYRYQGKWVMIDLGIGFADNYLPGIEIIVPDISFIVDRREDLLGLILTHAHEDHLGAVPYLWDELRCPVYATPFTAAVLKAKLAAEGAARGIKIHEVQPGAHTRLGPFDLEMVPLTHSIPEMQAIAIRTDKGVIMHTGDWKIDPDPLIGLANDDAVLQKYGDEGVLAMVCDSTNVFVEGHSGSEADVRRHLTELIAECPQRVLITTFASNIARVESIMHAAQEAGRKVAIAGRAFRRVIDAAQSSGYLKDIRPLIDEKDAMSLPRQDVLFLTTGCQGEPLAALSKIARGEHPSIRLAPGDMVIFSSRVIPGNESRVAYLHNRLVEMGVEVETGDHDNHVSGHPAREELIHMYQLLRPQISVPVHGEPRHIHEHTRLARTCQVPETVEARNGAVILLAKGEAQIIGQVESGYIAIDGVTLIPTDSPVIRARRKLRDDGCIIVTIILNKDGDLACDPVIIAPGSLDPHEDTDIFDLLSQDIIRSVEKDGRRKRNQLEQSIRTAIRGAIKRELGKKPVIEIKIVEV